MYSLKKSVFLYWIYRLYNVFFHCNDNISFGFGTRVIWRGLFVDGVHFSIF